MYDSNTQLTEQATKSNKQLAIIPARVSSAKLVNGFQRNFVHGRG